jgi:glycosyltransferase involved in cell wall biosynthesis
MHVSERDSGLYRQLRPDLRHIVVENGTSIRLREVIPDYAGQEKRILIFVGNLSAKMNYDALKHFATRFWPSLREYAGFRVVGSHPPAHVEKLCETKGWKLYANVSEDCLQRLYSEAHFAALPFAYGEGSKLKLFEACGRGVPALSTHCGVVGVKQLPALVTVSDDPQVWRKRVIETRSLAETELDQLIRFAEEFSWSKLAEKVLNAAQDCPAIA